MRFPRFAFFALVALTFAALAPASAFAADVATSVAVPVGDWLGALSGPLIQIVGALALAALGRVLLLLPAPLVGVLKTLHVDQLLERAVDYGINAVATAEKGKVLSVPIGNQVAAQALTYAVTMGPGWLTKFTGGPDALAKMITARIPFEASASVGIVSAS